MALDPRARRRRALIALAAAGAGFAALVAWNPAGLYRWILALHVLAIISWMAGMLYLPRLFVYHSMVPADSPQSATFKVMERRLLTVINTPAMLGSWATGLWLAWQAGIYAQGWMLAKFALVLALSGVHGYLSAATRAFAEDRNTRPHRHWRVVNEVPTLLMIGIVILVIVKPF